VIERAPGNFAAYVPDLPGCIATGKTIDDVRANIQSAIEMHLDGMRADGIPIPEPATQVTEIEVSVI
jgi:predicted RNase H-like HicB family nuclease